jgi:hypothetical protein
MAEAAAAPEAPLAELNPITPSREDLHSYVSEAAKANGLNPDFVSRLIQQESGWNPQIGASKRGAMGLMQVLPATAADYGVTNLDDPHENVRAGISHLARLKKLYNGNEELMAAAYNAGEGAVKAHGNTVPPFKETQAYVNAVAPLAQLNDVQKAETPKPPSPAEQKKADNIAAYAKANPTLWDKIKGVATPAPGSFSGTMVDMATGAGHILVDQANRLRPTIEKYVPGAQTAFNAMDAAVPPTQIDTTNKNMAQKIGAFGMKTGEYIAPLNRAAGLATAVTGNAPMLAKMAAQAVAQAPTSAGIAKLVGDNPKVAAVTGAIGGALSPAIAEAGQFVKDKGVDFMTAALKAGQRIVKGWPNPGGAMDKVDVLRDISEYVLSNKLTRETAKEQVAKLGAALDAAKQSQGGRIIPDIAQRVEQALVDIKSRFPTAEFSKDVQGVLDRLYTKTAAVPAVPPSKIVNPATGLPMTPGTPAVAATKVPRTDVTAEEAQNLVEDLRDMIWNGGGADLAAGRKAGKAADVAIRRVVNSTAPEMAAAKEPYGKAKQAAAALIDASARLARRDTVSRLGGSEAGTAVAGFGALTYGPKALLLKIPDLIKSYAVHHPMEVSRLTYSLGQALETGNGAMVAQIITRLSQVGVNNLSQEQKDGTLSERTKALMDQMRAQNDETVK